MDDWRYPELDTPIGKVRLRFDFQSSADRIEVSRIQRPFPRDISFRRTEDGGWEPWNCSSGHDLGIAKKLLGPVAAWAAKNEDLCSRVMAFNELPYDGTLWRIARVSGRMDSIEFDERTREQVQELIGRLHTLESEASELYEKLKEAVRARNPQASPPPRLKHAA